MEIKLSVLSASSLPLGITLKQTQQKVHLWVARFNSPCKDATPALEMKYEVGHKDAAQIYGLLETLKVPPLPDDVPHRGAGDCHRLTFAYASQQAEFCWELEPPQHWQALGDIASSLIALTRKHCGSYLAV